MAPETRRLLIEAVGARPAGHGFERLPGTGISDEVEEQALLALRDEGLVTMELIPHGLGVGRDRYEPSTLTDKGRRVLAAYKQACPECWQPLTLIDDEVRVGSGDVDNQTWQTGRRYQCADHGKWQVLGDGPLRRVDAQ